MFGVVFVVFSGLAAFINYELDTTLYSSAAPAIFIVLSVLTAMIPFIVSAVLSFAVAFITSNAAKSVAKKEPETQTKLKVDVEETST